MIRPILITGSSGVLGSNIRTYLTKKGVPTLGLDIQGYGMDYGDICNSSHILRILPLCKGVIHCAAISRVQDCKQFPQKAHTINVQGTKVLLEAIRKQKNKPWFLFFSSREVYGDVSPLPVIDEINKKPINTYGLTKSMAEELVLCEMNNGLRAGIVRCTNIYGCKNDKPSRIIPKIIDHAIHHKAISLYGNNRIFDFVHIDDLVAGIDLMTRYLERSSFSPMLLCSGEALTLNQIAQTIVSQLQSKSKIYIEACPSSDVQSFYGEPYLAKKRLQWRPNISFQEGITNYLALFQSRMDK